MGSKIDEINKLVDEALNDALANLSVDGIIPSEEEKQTIKEMLINELLKRQIEQEESKTK